MTRARCIIGLTGLLALCFLAAAGCAPAQNGRVVVPAAAPQQTATPQEQSLPIGPSATQVIPAEETVVRPIAAPSAESGTGLELELGCQLDATFSLLDARVWFTRELGAEMTLGAVVVPLQVTARGLWRALETDKASLYVAGGVTWREGFLVPSIAAGTAWSISDRISVSFEVGLAYTGPGGWLPPGPPPFIGGGASFLSLIGIGVLYHLP